MPVYSSFPIGVNIFVQNKCTTFREKTTPYESDGMDLHIAYHSRISFLSPARVMVQKSIQSLRARKLVDSFIKPLYYGEKESAHYGTLIKVPSSKLTGKNSKKK